MRGQRREPGRRVLERVRVDAEATYGHMPDHVNGLRHGRQVTDMEELFDQALRGSAGHDGAWDTSALRTMVEMFEYASSFNEDIGAWDTSGVTRMNSMFYYASTFNRDIGGWAVLSVTDMGSMFRYAMPSTRTLAPGASAKSPRWTTCSKCARPSIRTSAIGRFTAATSSMYRMFWKASAFDQDLGWCVDNDVNLVQAFSRA